MKVKEESEKAGLKLRIKKKKKQPRLWQPFPKTSCQIDGETVEIVTYFIFLDSKITADSDCILGIRRPLLLERKTMTNPDSTLKSRDMILPRKICIVKALVFQ